MSELCSRDAMMVRMPYTTGGNKKEIEICILLGYYTASSANSLLMFKDNLLVPSSRVKKSKKNAIEQVDVPWSVSIFLHLLHCWAQ